MNKLIIQKEMIKLYKIINIKELNFFLRKKAVNLMLHKKLIKTFPILIAFLAVFISCEVTFASDDPQGANKLVYKIPIEKEIERGLEAFLKRTTDEAIEAGANHIIFEIDTPGGRVDSAGQIGTLIQSLPIESTAYIVNEALSAGSYIALNANNIYMTPHSTM